MNIFKTLASGSGSINEPNVSAFLGYLLNPKEDHGLGDAFLKKFLEPLLDKNDNLNYNNPIQIAKKEICVCRGCLDEELIELIKNAKLDFKLDDIRI